MDDIYKRFFEEITQIFKENIHKPDVNKMVSICERLPKYLKESYKKGYEANK